MHAPHSVQRTARPSPDAPLALLHHHLGDPGVAWSVGIWGGIGEFRFDADEARTLDADGLTVVTARGGLRIAPSDAAVALEIRRDDRDDIEEIAFCLPLANVAGAQRGVLTEVGSDTGALRDAERHHILFDLGLGSAHVDGFVRVAPHDGALLPRLRAATGRSVLDGYGGAGASIAAASPPRVFCSPLARLEVYAAIPAMGGRSPEGPHSHLLPALLAQRRSQAPGSPIPDGWCCCLSLYPGAPQALPGEDQ
ncbi:MAG: hypothetical protein KIT36_24955 [Alphaproteobacteria bacterium]|nr:hypothetical protein [Alphaproteobacteria bacterium]